MLSIRRAGSKVAKIGREKKRKWANQMKSKNILFVLAICGSLAFQSCGKGSQQEPAAAEPPRGEVPASLPDNGFKAIISVSDPPAKLRTGQKEALQVNVKNASDVLWFARGARVNNAPTNQFYLAVADRWLAADGQKLITDMDGRYGLPRDLKPGEETNVPLVITAPGEPGDYILELDLVQEQVAWFHDKGSGTARVKIRVER
jgi:hypothetical protein